MVSLLPIISPAPADIRAAAGETCFQRGLAYFQRGAVGQFAVDAAGVSASVQGAKLYSVRLSFSDGVLNQRCSCPVGLRGAFCKHAVAAALVWSDAGKTEITENQSDALKSQLLSRKSASPDLTPPSSDNLGVPSTALQVENVATEAIAAATPILSEPFRAQPAAEPPPSSSADAWPEIPLIPVHILNEYVYCPRLAYMRWVQGEFADNADTVEGAIRHKRVDQEGGGLPAETDEEKIHAHSVALSSELLGITGKLDMVEGEGKTVWPVDYKKGKRPHRAAGAYDSERVQVCAQGLLLREHGFRSDRGIPLFHRLEGAGAGGF